MQSRFVLLRRYIHGTANIHRRTWTALDHFNVLYVFSKRTTKDLSCYYLNNIDVLKYIKITRRQWGPTIWRRVTVSRTLWRLSWKKLPNMAVSQLLCKHLLVMPTALTSQSSAIAANAIAERKMLIFYSFVYSCIHLCIHLFIHTFILSFIILFIHSFIFSYIS